MHWQFPIVIGKFCTPDNIALFDKHLECLEKRGDTVGELRTAEICVSYMSSLKAKKLEKLTQEKAALER
jgi:hypothetical protein